MSKITSSLVATGMLAAVVLVPVTAATAAASTATAAPSAVTAPTAKKFKNCTALNKVYPHGVGKSKSVKDKTTGTPVTNFKVKKKVYLANYKSMDRDRDGIACEKR